jgi:hypothetical protein
MTRTGARRKRAGFSALFCLGARWRQPRSGIDSNRFPRDRPVFVDAGPSRAKRCAILLEMRPIALTAAALLACQGCTGEISGIFTMTDGGDSGSGVAGFAGALGSAGQTASGGGSGTAGAVASGGRGGSAGTSVAAGGSGGISAAGGAGGTTGASGAIGAGGGPPLPCGLDSASCTSCLGPLCPDAIQACTTSTSCLDAVSLLAGCVCPASPNGKTSDKCLVEFAGRGALEAPFAKCMQTATTCKSLCGL